MSLFWVSGLLFFSAYVINMLYITVFYHRGLTHRAVQLGPKMQNWVAMTGSWVTGIDPKAWSCMHRMHHLYSDTELDPHSPSHLGIFGVMLGQLKSYERVLIGLSRNESQYTEVVKDLNFEISWANRKKVWLLPYLLHLVIAILVGFAFQSWVPGAAYWLGIMSHPFEGFIVNSFAHRFGYRNHQNDDDSRNNTVVAWLTMGEGYQNNHHANPASPKFSERWFEVDSGYALCLIAKRLGFISFQPKSSPLSFGADSENYGESFSLKHSQNAMT